MASPFLIFHIFTFLFFAFTSHASFPIGVTYGTEADNLPPPSQVAHFIKKKTIFDRVRILNTNHDILTAFANTNISVMITTSSGDDGEIIKLADPLYADNWVKTNILPFYPQTRINIISISNEIISLSDKEILPHLVPAMKTLHSALIKAGIKDIKVSATHPIGLLAFDLNDGVTMSQSQLPSMGQFRPDYDHGVLPSLLAFLRETKSPFLLSASLYSITNSQTLNFAVSKPPNPGVHDNSTGFTYTNMFDALVDGCYTALKKSGYDDLEIVMVDVGWPSASNSFEGDQSSIENALSFNDGLVKRTKLGKGTPLLPNKRIVTYILSLFDQNLLTSPASQKHYGLFKPDFTPAYDAGVLRLGLHRLHSKNGATH